MLAMWIPIPLIYSCFMYAFNELMIKINEEKIYNISKNEAFLNHLLVSLIEIPADLLLLLIIDNKNIGRKKTLAFGFFFTFFFSLICFFFGKYLF